MSNQKTETILATALFIIADLVILFHILVISGLIPQGITWGGRTESRQQTLVMETISLAIDGALAYLAAIKAGLVKKDKYSLRARTALWIFAGIFLLNTIGNIFARNSSETMLFTPVTLLLCLVCTRLAMYKDPACEA
ncbi:MAG: hypothetical protein MUE58_14215 [Chitinophagaceae bacterium]|jgi:hypothetical protein|nr:hypothetical protein [Chitinophagaceae bacterium]